MQKRTNWMIEVQQTVLLSVDFGEPVTSGEALKLYNEGLYEDVVDESLLEETAVHVEED